MSNTAAPDRGREPPAGLEQRAPQSLPVSPPSTADTLDPTLSFVVCGLQTEVGQHLADLGADSSELGPGVAVLGRYVIEREIGRGGMGRVFLARDNRLARDVALKVCRLLSEDRACGTVQRAVAELGFVEEAQIGASLSHPAIATVYDFGLHQGLPFTVFEYLEGESLRMRMLRQGRMPLEDVRHIIGPLAQALDFAHGQHVVHLDLKPENIRCTRQGHFKILDLGLAKEFRRNLDWTGFAGTPAYASPEQAAGQPCDGRSDQYALALIVFEMLSGDRVFVAKDPQALLHMHREASPDAVVAADWIPNEVRQALLRALCKDPNQRFNSCTEFATALGCRLLDVPSPPRSVVLRDATVEHIATSWLTRGEGTWFLRNPQRLVLTADALWVCQEDMVWRLPLACVQQISPDVPAEESTACDAERKAEQVRAANRVYERHVMLVGGLCYLLGLTIAAITLLLSPAILAQGDFAQLAFWCVVSAIPIAAGWGLRSWSRWGWWLGVGITALVTGGFLSGAVALLAVAVIRQDALPVVFVLSPGAACGLIAGGYFLWLLASRHGRFLFSPEYREVRALTPHVASRALALRAGTLRLTLADSQSRQQWRFRFTTRAECRAWAAHLAALRTTAPEAGEVQQQPVALLKSKPPLALLVLGDVRSMGPSRSDAEAGVRIQCAMLGGDAVINLSEEELPAYHGTMRESVGLAATTVDELGKQRLRSLWFARRARAIAAWLVALVALDFALNLLGMLLIQALMDMVQSRPPLTNLAASVALILLIHSWPAVIVGVFAWLRWPQLALPAALSVVALLARPLIVAFVALWHWDSLFALLLLFDPIQWAMLAVALFLARSALRSLRLMRTGSAPATIFEPLLRTNVARAAWIGCLCFTLLFSGFLGYEINQVWPAMIGAIRQSIDDGQLLAGPQLPGCDSPQVVQLVNKLVRDLNIAPSISAIDGHRQISFDATAQRRVGLCIAHTKPSAIPIVYTITWLDRDKRQFSVSVQIGSDLPPQTKS